MKTLTRSVLFIFSMFFILSSANYAYSETLSVGNTGNSIKPAMIVLAQEMGYYKDEGVTVEIKQISNLNDGIAAVQMGKLDILPLGIIPSMAFIAKGADLVVYGGTISEGAQAITLQENRDKYNDIKNFKGKKIAFFRPETGHMFIKDKIRTAGHGIENDVVFVQLDGFQSIIEAVAKGMVDVGIVNSGFGYIAEKKGLAVAFNIGKYIPNGVCCRQTTSRSCFEKKHSDLVKFQIANLRAYKLAKDDPKLAVKKLAEYSGQPEDFVKYCLFSGVMKYTMDPATNRIQDFYKVMASNGDLPKNAKKQITDNVDSSIYLEALTTIMRRYPMDSEFKRMRAEFAANNKN